MRTELRERPSDGSHRDGPMEPLVELAPAKVNLTLAVKGRRLDGFHELESLVAFAAIGDELRLVPAPELSLEVSGEFAGEAGPTEANLVLRAADALGRRLKGLRYGAFFLEKRLPVAAGLGGGSADAAAALRLIAKLNGLSPQCEALVEAARETGSDVPVCLSLGCRVMQGRGEILGPALGLPSLPALLVNPRERLDTGRVFAALGARPGARAFPRFAAPARPDAREWLSAIEACGNDLEAPAIRLAPAIEVAKLGLAAEAGCLLARMTGSGATVVGLFENADAAASAALSLVARYPSWWVRPTSIDA